jgi:hypothetical protein
MTPVQAKPRFEGFGIRRARSSGRVYCPDARVLKECALPLNATLLATYSIVDPPTIHSREQLVISSLVSLA